MVPYGAAVVEWRKVCAEKMESVEQEVRCEGGEEEGYRKRMCWMEQEEGEEGDARILFNTWNLAKDTHSIIVSLLAWGTGQKITQGGEAQAAHPSPTTSRRRFPPKRPLLGHPPSQRHCARPSLVSKCHTTRHLTNLPHFHIQPHLFHPHGLTHTPHTSCLMAKKLLRLALPDRLIRFWCTRVFLRHLATPHAMSHFWGEVRVFVRMFVGFLADAHP